MRKAADIIGDLGGPTAVAKAIGLPVTTVHGWSRFNFVPEWRRAALVKLAEQRGKKLEDHDFPPIEQRISRTAAA
jgi:hypothetical protein